MSEAPVPRPDLAIDLDKVLAKKFPGKKIPKWFINWMKRFIHQDWINTQIVKGYEGVEFCTEGIKFLDVKLDVHGLENVVVPEGSYMTFACNHPLGGIDGVAMGSLVGENFGHNVRFMVNDFLMALPGISDLSVPINKTGAQGRDLPRLIKELYQSPNNIMIFPAGLCSRKIKGKIQDLPWGKNFIKNSRETSRWVVPVHFIGRNSNRFYNIANICKFLKLKFNVAMLFLPDEMYRQRGGTFKVIFGKPIPPETFDKSKTDTEWAAWVREKVYEL
ncbi:MAG: glycerol acyltransferase [Bacteroidales bacterium]|nr:glycerol acyltransferase [Bacteroidales bacterium]